MPEPASLTDIANLSLTLIGQKPINNIDTTTNIDAQNLRRWMPVVIREIQQEIHWDELYSELVPLVAITDEFAGVEGQFQYILPEDFLQMYEVTARPNVQNTIPIDSRPWNNPWWKLEAGRLIARVDGLEIMYGRYDENVAAWSVQQRQVIYTALAEKMCLLITNNNTLQEMLTKKLKRVKMEAFVSRQNKSRSFKTRPQNFTMSQNRTANYSAGRGRGF